MNPQQSSQPGEAYDPHRRFHECCRHRQLQDAESLAPRQSSYAEADPPHPSDAINPLARRSLTTDETSLSITSRSTSNSCDRDWQTRSCSPCSSMSCQILVADALSE